MGKNKFNTQYIFLLKKKKNFYYYNINILQNKNNILSLLL